MNYNILQGILIPLIGTTLGSACVFFLKKKMNNNLENSLNGFASGVMIAASIWSLIIPSIEGSKNLEKLAFIPATVGLLTGVAFLIIIEKALP